METGSLRELCARYATLVCLLIVTLELGGGLYERIVVDAAWPNRISLIQPSEGGLNRKNFWMPLHAILMVSLPLAVWACWREPTLRWQLLVATGLYVVMRAWTFAYFIPRALGFEEAVGRTDLTNDARRWIFWSFWRTPMVIAAMVSLAAAVRRLWAP